MPTREELEAQWVALQDQRAMLDTQERELAQALAPLLCGLPLGSIIEIPQPKSYAGRWRVTSYRMYRLNNVRVHAVNIKKDGTEGNRHAELWDWTWKAAVIVEHSTQEDASHGA